MISMSFKGDIRIPKIVLKEELRHIANSIIVAGMQQNIDNQVTLDENPLPKNEPATLKAKEKKGYGTKTLIASRRLMEDFRVTDAGPYAIKISIHPERKEIAKYLQIEGIKTKKGNKYFNFFGISTRMERSAIAYMKVRIKEILTNARSKQQ